MKLYLASGNLHKAQEMTALVKGSGGDLEIVSASAIGGMPAVAEDTGTFIGNARKKALALSVKLSANAWVLSDDSGLCVDALDGAPGVESAYYAGAAADSSANLTKLVEAMKPVVDGRRSACFVCVLLLRGPMGLERIFEGRCNGTLLREPVGEAGFGYDPLFVPDGQKITFSQMSEAQKNQVSHRAKATEELVRWLRDNVAT